MGSRVSAIPSKNARYDGYMDFEHRSEVIESHGFKWLLRQYGTTNPGRWFDSLHPNDPTPVGTIVTKFRLSFYEEPDGTCSVSVIVLEHE